jgi:release factor glutamine methyltransferase
MASLRVIELYGIRVCLNDNVYEPSDDTELIMSILKVRGGETVVDLGSGTGILGIYAAKEGARVISIDVNPYAAEATLCSAKLNGVDLSVINCNMLSCLREWNFHTLIFNPPYLPYNERDSWIGYSWSGGKGGVEVILEALRLPFKRIYLTYSSLSDEELLLSSIRSEGLKVRKEASRVMGYEEIKAVELER